MSGLRNGLYDCLPRVIRGMMLPQKHVGDPRDEHLFQLAPW